MAGMVPLPDLAQLSNEDLRDQLESYGVNVGPIVSTTRLFYEKKLGKLIDSGGSPPPSHEDTEESEEEDYEEEEEVVDEEVQFNYKQPQMQQAMPTRPYTEAVPSRPPAPAVPSKPQPQTPYTPITQQRRGSPTRATTARHRPGVASEAQMAQSTDNNTNTKSGEEGGGISMWIKLLFIIIVAFIVYLVIINMNPTTQNKIPMSIDDV